VIPYSTSAPAWNSRLRAGQRRRDDVRHHQRRDELTAQCRARDLLQRQQHESDPCALVGEPDQHRAAR